jgi:HSP20 family protein
MSTETRDSHLMHRSSNGADRQAGAASERPVERIDRRRTVTPPVDVLENADEILVLADVPGAQTDSITVRLDKDQLYLHARSPDDSAGHTRLAGRASADYVRTFIVPPGIDGNKIAAEMKDGVLKIHLPKSEALKPRTIQVRTI